mmetsp:Transcript_139998/g.447760  ORF Transcript_139998/g.447760 Transcript_139998/m.447760 type:complete len:240 (-) Transcript_139998:901-1620(-)
MRCTRRCSSACMATRPLPSLPRAASWRARSGTRTCGRGVLGRSSGHRRGPPRGRAMHCTCTEASTDAANVSVCVGRVCRANTILECARGRLQCFAATVSCSSSEARSQGAKPTCMVDLLPCLLCSEESTLQGPRSRPCTTAKSPSCRTTASLASGARGDGTAPVPRCGSWCRAAWPPAGRCRTARATASASSRSTSRRQARHARSGSWLALCPSLARGTAPHLCPRGIGSSPLRKAVSS